MKEEKGDVIGSVEFRNPLPKEKPEEEVEAFPKGDPAVDPKKLIGLPKDETEACVDHSSSLGDCSVF